MTRLNTTIHNNPFLLSPAGKDYLWGGRRLKDSFSKNIPLTPLAETWECSVHPDGPSVVASGSFQGKKLIDVIRDHPEFLGTHPDTRYGLPILVKFIDAYKDLSVQVHPSDEYALKYENSLGKSEMWYVIDAAKGAKLVYGFKRNISKETLRKAALDGSIEKYLNRIDIHPGDVFYIEAGTVHAICEGALIAEIQESSNLTYRLYDYNRRDKNGNLRELHIDKAIDVANTKSSTSPRQPMHVLKYQPGYSSTLLARCKYFQVEKIRINTEHVRDMADYSSGSTSFEVLLCIDGCGSIFGDNFFLNFIKGDCIFVPANSPNLKLHGKADMLRIYC